MAKLRNYSEIKKSLSDGKCFGKTDMTPWRDRVVPKEMKADTRQQAPQDPINAHGPGYSNKTSGWVRGAGGDATKRPFFVPTKKGSR
jgi:hypothetical protein